MARSHGGTGDAKLSQDETVLDVLYLNSPRASQKNLLYRQVTEDGRVGMRRLLIALLPPKEVVAAIVTCGGLCPGGQKRSEAVGADARTGLNNVIKAIVDTLLKTYEWVEGEGAAGRMLMRPVAGSVKKVWGIQFGYKGFYSLPWIDLDCKAVENVRMRLRDAAV
eukprot:750403-Hanusia_phi.AAC.3